MSSVMTDRPDLGPGDQTVVSATISEQGIAFFMQGLLTAENVATHAVTLADAASVRIEVFSASQNQWTALANLDFGPFGTTSPATPPNSSWSMFSRTFGDPGVTATGFSAPGTTIAPGSTATWFYSYFALLPMSSATQLVQAAQTGSVRLSINLPAAGNPSVPLISAIDLTSAFASASVVPLSAVALSATLDSGAAVILSPTAPLTDGQTDAVFTGTLTAPTLNPRGAFDDDGTYIQYLLAQAALSHRVSVSSTVAGGASSSTNLTLSSSVPVVDFGLQPPPPIVSGASTHFDLQFRNDGTGPAGPISLAYAIASTPAGSTVAPPELVAGATGTGSVDFTAPAPSPLNDELSLTWMDRDGNLYGPLTRTSESCPIGSCAAVIPAQVPSQEMTSSNFGRHLSVVASSNVPIAVPGDLVTFAATITNDGIEVPGLTDTVSLKNTGFTPFAVQGYEQNLQYLSVATNEWVTVAIHAVDSTGAVTGDPSVAQLGTAGGIPLDAPGVSYSTDPIVGTTIDPGARASWNLFVGNTLLPPDVFKLIQDPTQSAGVRTTFRFDGIGDVTPPAAVTDVSAPFVAASSALGTVGVSLSYSGYQLDGSSVFEVPFPPPAESAPLALGASRTFTLTLPMYPGIVRGAASSDDDYLNSLEYSTEPGNRPTVSAFETGPVGAFALTSVAFHRVVPIVSPSKTGPAQGNAGLPQTYSVTLTNSGAVDALGVSATDSVDGELVSGATFATLTVPAGATRTGALKAPTPLDRPSGPMTDVATVTWQDKNGNVYGPVSGNYTMNVLPAHPEGYLALSASGTQVQTRGTAATITAIATTSVGAPVAGLAVHVSVSGANAQGLDLVTGTDGTATFSYDGPNLGGDTLTAAATISGPPVHSQPLQLTWVSSVGTPCTGRATPLDVVIVIDGSPSMFTDDQIEMAQSATATLVKDLDFTRDQVGGILFSGGADVYAQLTSDGAQATTQINQGINDYVHACDGFCAGGTNFPAALQAALAELQSSRHRPEATPLMIFLSDGGNTGSDPTLDIAAVKAAGIRAVSIGYGPSVNAPLMLKIASSSNDYFLAPSIRELNWAIANVVGDACRTLPPLVSAGPSQTGYEVRLPGILTLQGEAHGAGPQGNLGLTSTWTQVSGPAPAIFVDPSSPTTSVLFSQPGTYVFQLETSDGFLKTASTTTVTVDSDPSIVGANLSLALASAGPLTTGTTETAIATLVDGNGVPISNFTVKFTVAGANAGAVTLLTSSAGVATFSYSGANAGTDVIHATALGSTFQLDSASLSVDWAPPAGAAPVVTQGWIGSPVSQSTVMGLVPITAGAGVTLASASVSYWPAKSPDDVHVLNGNASGGPGATLATLDTTGLSNGGYVIDVQGTDSDGHTQESAVLVTVAGDYKPGRLVAEVTEFTVPVAGIPISVGRRYDSLTKDKVGDFGNGWSLTVGHPDLQVGPTHDVTITLPSGRRATFFLTPFQYPFPFKSLYQPLYTAEAGVFGSLTGDGCPLLVPNGGQIVCFEEGDSEYSPTTYKYTDPYGTVYTMGADGSLKSIQDRTNNVINFTSDGISSPVSGQTVSFTRDGLGRITRILTPDMGDFFHSRFEYDYAYDAAGNLMTAQAPSQNVYSQITQYTYDGTHRLLTTIDPAGHHARTSTFDDEGRLASDTDGMGNVTSYAYDVVAHKTTTTYPDTGVLSQTFDDRGLLLSQTDQLGRTTTHQYDANRNETKRTNALGEPTTYTYDANGNQTSSTNARGESTTTTYNAFSEPLTSTNPVGNTTTFTYDSNGLPTSIADSMGPVAAFTSSDHGLPLTVTDAAGSTVFFSYDAAGNLASRMDRLGRFTSYQYDQMGRKTSMTDPRGGTTTYTYDQDGDLLTNIDPLGFGPLRHYEANRNLGELATTTQYVGVNVAIARGELYSYDANNHLATILHESDGTQIRQIWDFRGNLLTRTDEAGHTTNYAYDVAGQLVKTTYTDGAFITQSYDPLGRQASKTDERNHTTTYAYETGCDCSQRITSVTDPLGRTTAMTYDGMGRKTSTTDANGHRTAYVYDLRGHLTDTDYADGTSTHDTYDVLGRRTASTDQTGATTTYAYDAGGQLTSVVDPLGHVTTYGYDANGNLTSATDADNHTTTYAYDAANRKISRTLPLGASETFGYDSDGNETSHTDFAGKTTTYAFDNRRPGRRISKLPDPSLGERSVGYTYNADGTRASMTDASGTTTYAYDVRGRVLTKSTPEGTLTYGYDASSNVATIESSNANGTSLEYAWDAGNQLISVTDNRAGGTTTAAYSLTGQPASLVHPNGVGVTYGYDVVDRVTAMNWKKGTNPGLASWTYSYNPRGERVSAVEGTGRAVTYAYDASSRLASETVSGDPGGAAANGGVTYSLDPAGNRLSRTSTLTPVAAQTLAYDPNDRLTSDSYDANGNTTGSGDRTYRYDFENRLVSKDGGRVVIVYDGDGNRVQKTVDGVTTSYLSDDLNPTGYLQVLDEVRDAVVQVRYTYGNRLVSQTRMSSGASITSFYGYDAHGNIAFLTDLNGTVTDTYSYDAWGAVVSSSGATRNTRRYAGEELDPDLGAINLRARMYLPETGRFLTADPWTSARPLAMPSNGYLYANADPVNLLDPGGHLASGEYGAFLQVPTAVIAPAPFAGATAVAAAATAASAGAALGVAGLLGYKTACNLAIGVNGLWALEVLEAETPAQIPPPPDLPANLKKCKPDGPCDVLADMAKGQAKNVAEHVEEDHFHTKPCKDLQLTFIKAAVLECDLSDPRFQYAQGVFDQYCTDPDRFPPPYGPAFPPIGPL